MNGDNISVLVLFIGWGGFDRRTTIFLYFWLIIRRLHCPHNSFVDLSSLSHLDFQNWKCEAIGHFNLLTLFCGFIMGWKPSSCHPFVMIEHYNCRGTTFASWILRLNWNLFVLLYLMAVDHPKGLSLLKSLIQKVDLKINNQ